MKRLKAMVRESSPAGELYVLAQRMFQRAKERKLVVFPYAMYRGTSGDLRGTAVGYELRRRGWRTIIVPPWLGLGPRRRIIRAERPDAILMQQSIHPLNRPAFYPGVPCVFDADDAYIINTPEVVAECCRDSAAVIAGSRNLARQFRQFNSNVSIIWTGTYVLEAAGAVSNCKRKPIIAWAHSDVLSAEYEAAFIREILLRLAKREKFSLRLYGASEPAAIEEYLRPIRAAGIAVETFKKMRYREFIDSMAEVAIGLTPICKAHAFFQGKSFGKILAYMAADVAVIAANAIDHPLFFRHGENGMLADESVDQWVECCADLLRDPVRRGQIVARGREEFLQRLTTARCAELVDGVLSQVIGSKTLKENPLGNPYINRENCAAVCRR